MNVIVTILVKESAGVLSAVVLKLSPMGYRLESHKKLAADPGFQRMRLHLRCPSAELAQVERDLRGVQDGIRIEDIELEKTQSAVDDSARTEKEVLGDIVQAFPEVSPIVRRYGSMLSDAARSKSLFDLGSKTGRATYKRDFALGSPLKMPAAWRRVIVPAVRNFGETKASDDSVTLLNCPFCSSGPEVNCCEFVTGFVQGLLDAGPYTQDRRVRETACKSKGEQGCTFAIDN